MVDYFKDFILDVHCLACHRFSYEFCVVRSITHCYWLALSWLFFLTGRSKEYNQIYFKSYKTESIGHKKGKLA